MPVTKIGISIPHTNNKKGCVITLPGRGVPGSLMIKYCRRMRFNKTIHCYLQPYQLSWYPQPDGADNQEEAALGLPAAVSSALDAVESIKRACNITNKEIILLGFSAGAVVALQLAMQNEFAACISLAGAILEPEKVQKATNDTPIILQHNSDDLCFKWFERYLPMKTALKDNGYNIHCLEGHYGGHGLYLRDAIAISNFVRPLLGYKKGI